MAPKIPAQRLFTPRQNKSCMDSLSAYTIRYDRHMTTYMTVQKASFFLREDTRKWQPCFTAVLQDTLSGHGFWTMAVLRTAPANSSTHTSRNTTAGENRVHLPAEQNWVFSERAWGLEHDPWKSITEQLTPLAAFPGTIFYRKSTQLRSWLCLVSASAILSYVFLSIYIYFKSQSQHKNSASLYLGWSSFQHFSRRTEVGADLCSLCSDPSSAAQTPACNTRGSMPREGAPFGIHHMISCCLLFCSAFTTTHRTAETLVIFTYSFCMVSQWNKHMELPAGLYHFDWEENSKPVVGGPIVTGQNTTT